MACLKAICGYSHKCSVYCSESQGDRLTGGPLQQGQERNSSEWKEAVEPPKLFWQEAGWENCLAADTRSLSWKKEGWLRGKSRGELVPQPWDLIRGLPQFAQLHFIVFLCICLFSFSFVFSFFAQLDFRIAVDQWFLLVPPIPSPFWRT